MQLPRLTELLVWEVALVGQSQYYLGLSSVTI